MRRTCPKRRHGTRCPARLRSCWWGLCPGVLVSWCPGVLVSWWVWCWWGWQPGGVGGGVAFVVAFVGGVGGVCALLVGFGVVVGGVWWGCWWFGGCLCCVCVAFVLRLWWLVGFVVVGGGVWWGLWWLVVVCGGGRVDCSPARTDRRRIRKTLLECFTNWLDFDDLWFRFRPCYYYKYEYANYRH